MKPIEGYNKLRGGYYTPEKIAEFIATWAIRTKNDEILEPSCGDGSFISAIADRLHKMGNTMLLVLNWIKLKQVKPVSTDLM